MRVIGIAALAGLALSGRCPTQAEQKRPDPPKLETPTDVPAPRLLQGQVRLTGHAEAIDRAEMDPVCGTEACGNATRDTCLARHRGSDIEVYAVEPCDGPALGGASCEDLGYRGGALTCSADCDWGLSGCELCAPGACTIQPTVGGFAEVQVFSVTHEEQRIRLSWVTREHRGGLMQSCAYSAFADEPVVPNAETCSVIGWPLYPHDVDVDGDGQSDKTPRSWGRAQWGATADEECRTVDIGAAQLRILPRQPALRASAPTPLLGMWFVDDQPHGEPVRIANDPLASGCIEGVLANRSLVVVWHSPAHGLVTRRLALPELAHEQTPGEDRSGRPSCEEAPSVSTHAEQGRCH
ncbi:MAG: hypothetical protein ACRBN8_36440 [Nannocystales bacterium]